MVNDQIVQKAVAEIDDYCNKLVRYNEIVDKMLQRNECPLTFLGWCANIYTTAEENGVFFCKSILLEENYEKTSLYFADGSNACMHASYVSFCRRNC